MSLSKFDIIEKLKNLDNKISNIRKSNVIGLKNDDLVSENIKLKEEIEKLKKSEELKFFHSNPKFEEFYDIIIDINSIKNVNKEGWKVKFNERGLENYKKYKDKSLITVGVLGNRSKGKSFILSKISKIKLLAGIHTEGLSVKYPELKGYKGRQITFIDSVGFEKPVLKHFYNEKKEKRENHKENIEDDNEKQQEKRENEEKNIEDEEIILENKYNKEMEQYRKFKENAIDKMVTEFFLQNLIINISDILLVVVGELTYSEQLLIQKIKV